PAGAVPYRPAKRRTPVKWGRPIAMTLFLLLVAGIAGLHLIPLPMERYEQTASAVLGTPVRIESGRLSLIGGPHLAFSGVRIGDAVRIRRANAYPEIGSFFDERKAFRRIEAEGAAVPQQALGAALFGRARGDQFTVARVVLKDVKLEGTLPLPPLEAEALLGPDGAVRSVRLRGPDGLAGTLTPAGQAVEFDVTAERFTVPFAPEVALSSFAMKGKATSQSLEVASWGGAVLDGALSGVANVRWTSRWEVNGALTVRGINAAVFAPALLSEGKAEGSGKFVMAGADPAALAAGARLEGSFTVHKGVLGNIDLSRVIQTGGRQHAGRTQFVELKAQGLYDRGAIALRDIAISAGALNAGASADIAQNGALSGRIVADVKTASQTLRQTLQLGGTVKEPQVRN
ncbi:MAG TPA: hypothetical protein VM489_17005, partial [Burkholderiales bacterium]|nr:hypothetical protein [Burkholderiales bacterium]